MANATIDLRRWAPDPPNAVERGSLRRALELHGHWTPLQIAGRHWEVGCVALEITQRCNLDCELCYLSEHSEAVRDLPLDEVFRRIDLIAQCYGPATNVQVTGGDPTLRKRDELVAIVRRLVELGLKPALFTNGIKATRDLLEELAGAGLKDVAFHVDITQRRKGFASEEALNRIRLDYIERARGLGLHVLFNTSVTRDNIEAVPMLARFFRDHADIVHLASFQPHADTGRGVKGKGGLAITPRMVSERIEAGLGTELGFDRPLIGHPECNQYSGCLVAGRVVAPLFDAPGLIAALLERTSGIRFERHDRWQQMRQCVEVALRNIDLWPAGLVYAGRKFWQLRRAWRAGHWRVHKLSFHVHNFMDAGELDPARCETCVFKVMTRDGPISMCVHNAKRDAFITQPISRQDGETWYPLGTEIVSNPSSHPLKRLKGKTRQMVIGRGRRVEAPP